MAPLPLPPPRLGPQLPGLNSSPSNQYRSTLSGFHPPQQQAGFGGHFGGFFTPQATNNYAHGFSEVTASAIPGKRRDKNEEGFFTPTSKTNAESGFSGLFEKVVTQRMARKL